jgi:hypothetical protein
MRAVLSENIKKVGNVFLSNLTSAGGMLFDSWRAILPYGKRVFLSWRYLHQYKLKFEADWCFLIP